MKRTDRKSDCPINYCLEIFGDTWSLLILRDIVFLGKNTYGEFLSSNERITTNILANRLVALEKNKILKRKKNPTDKRTDTFVLTEKGLALIPTLLEMMEWGTSYDQNSAGHRKIDFVNQIRKHKSAFAEKVIREVEEGRTAFNAV